MKAMEHPAGDVVSIVIATCDRPDQLHQCLSSLVAADSKRDVEIVVVDNHPDSGLTRPVAAQFPGVRWLAEARPGVAYARNTGVSASRGSMIAIVDDDVVVARDWLEKLLGHFIREDVMAVTGNVLPLTLETPAEQWFEQFGEGGLGRGEESFEMNAGTFRRTLLSVPTWKLGGTANVAFRASIFRDPAIGVFKESLGPGMPSGGGEDIYLFFKILKAGYTIVYEPAACVRHRHRATPKAIQDQIYNYSKGFICYQLTTLFADHDARALVALFVTLPVHRLRQISAWITRNQSYPFQLILLEIAGNCAAPLALWESHRRVRRLREARGIGHV
jgi:GT2 family glycosyltransferase